MPLEANRHFFQKSSRAAEIGYYDMDYREKVLVFGEEKIKKLGSLLKAKLKNSS